MFDAIGYFLSALRLIRQPGMRRWVILPLTFNILLFIVLYGLAGSALAGWVAAASAGWQLEGSLAFLNAAITASIWLLQLLVWLALLMLFASTFTIAVAAFTALAYVTGHAIFADYLLLVHFSSAAELTVFCGALVGAGLGFLWYNSYPAELFMGDVGSLALGGALGTVAILIKQELLLPIVGAVFVIEAFSVIIQVGSFKLTGQRVFRMAPLHHHCELIGWSEPKVMSRFLIVAVVFACFSLATLKLR